MYDCKTPEFELERLEKNTLSLQKMSGKIQNVIMRRAKTWVMVVLFALFSLYSDIFAFKVPLFAFLVCPFIILVAVVGVLIVNRIGVKNVLLRFLTGPPVILLAVFIFTPALGQLHDQWIMQEVRDWGTQLRAQKKATGTYPESQTKFIHGYRAVLINHEPLERAVIIFDRFGQIRQSYSVGEDRFLEK